MKNITRHTGKLEIIKRLPSSANGNPRYMCKVDVFSFVTRVDCSEAYNITNYNGQIVTVAIGTHYGITQLDSIKKGN